MPDNKRVVRIWSFDICHYSCLTCNITENREQNKKNECLTCKENYNRIREGKKCNCKAGYSDDGKLPQCLKCVYSCEECK